MKTDYDLNETLYLPFKINEIFVNSLGEVTYTLASVAPFMIYRQTGIDQIDLNTWAYSWKRKKHEENI